ncbi:hypothetical protein [Chromohalobacter israelensis]|nr:hypothetical protein [Chromohalobacter salexigens]
MTVSAVAIGLYLYQFGGGELDSDSSVWADLGTYLSGTVGVAAVTFTLFALILTLKQQDAIIEAQDEESRRGRAYENAIQIFPKILSSAHKDLQRHLSFDPGCVRDIAALDHDGPITPESILRHPNRFRVLGEVSPNCLRSIVNQSIGHPYRVTQFMVQQIHHAPELFDYFDCLLDEYRYWDCVEAVYAYHVGSEQDDEFCYLVRSKLRMRLSYNDPVSVEGIWQRIGAKLNE